MINSIDEIGKIYRMFYRILWKFDHKDKSTWKYLECDTDVYRGKEYIRWKKNPEFLYEHLSPYGKETNWNRMKKESICL